MRQSTIADDAARLHTRPAPPTADVLEAGLYQLELGAPRDGILYVPDADGPRPLLVTLHGATMNAQMMLRPLLAAADDFGVILLVPDSRSDGSWDVIAQRAYGPDVEFIDQALAATFAQCRIDPAHVGVGGVSDGASYALSLGVTNGDLFPRIVAFSPGFLAPTGVHGQPSVFVSHGTHDQILPIDMCGRPIVNGLRGGGYDVEFLEFDGGHEMPDPVIRSAFAWFTT